MDGGRPAPLPMAGSRPPRTDAAANRDRILAAARRLVADEGVEALRMDAVARAAGVGKGTVFRRFGDRLGLRKALIDDAARELQEGFLRGPPPLGPGAPAAERLEAFAVALVTMQREQLSLALLGEARAGEDPPAATGVFALHATELLRQAGGYEHPEVLATMLLGALAPSTLDHLARWTDPSVAEVRDAARTLVRALLTAGRPAPDAPP